MAEIMGVFMRSLIFLRIRYFSPFILITMFVFIFITINTIDVNADNKTLDVPFFDGIKLQTTNSYPKLTNANHMIHAVNRLTGSELNNWKTINIFTLDIVLWKDLSKYFKTDFAISGTTGSLVSSSTGFQGTPLDTSIRMRQRYTALELWTNLYYYPFTTNYKDEYKSGHIIEPFVAAGFGYTFFKSESVFKMRKSNLFYDRIRNNWNKGAFAYKMMTGFNINLGYVNSGMDRWVITVSAFYIWNRLKGRSNMHLTDGMTLFNKKINSNVQISNRMDIDLTGPCFSLGVGRYF